MLTVITGLFSAGNGVGRLIKEQSDLSIPKDSQKASLFKMVADIIRTFVPNLKRTGSAYGDTSIGLN